ncbi:unnamed protein product [Rotaria sordida]|uniref:Uncharacterized protein n=1 Tax=Rotaria sordida TaxID=392033 RepID=A0A818XZT2_9BILA|nr:unnamed protein product [Rotaria sordida]CAF3746467.1 unnamed protein product [Rotaria sordida]
MQFESLANELLLELFKCLTTSHIFHAFHGLNRRFDALILEYFRKCNIDFRSISKCDFDIICEQHLTEMVDRITSLCLSDEDDTPGQIDQFFGHGFTFQQFINLKSLYLYDIRSETMMDKVMFDLPYLSNLTHLTFGQCYFPLRSNNEKAVSFGSCIWSLPKLVCFCVKVEYKYRQTHHFADRCRRDNGIFIIPTVTSLTLEYLSFIGMKQCDIVMDQLFAHTPRLRHILADNCLNIHMNSLSIIPSMTTLNISLSSSQYRDSFFNFLRKTPNLRHLKVEFCSVYLYVDGQRWEQMIRNYLAKLERLQFKMLVSLNGDLTEEGQVDRILDKFRSQFWLVEHRWFVQCDWNLYKEFVILYTLPYAFNNFYFYSPIQSKSTSPYDNDLRSYDNVHSLIYKPRLFNISSSPHIQFSNIQHLSIEFPISAHFWSIVPRFDHLISLDALSNNYDEHCQHQLEDLLDRAPRLSSIRLGWKTLTSPLIKLFESRNWSVYQLELLCYGRSLNKKQCIMISDIIPSIHCKVLNLMVANRTCILDLINTMNYLRALNIQCQYDKSNRSIESTQDELCEWLQQQLSPRFSTTKISRRDTVVRMWIR